ncbi:DUF6659 family protein [Nitrosopumilus sp.]|uniref:DUF6659 family protein n=1 Tax=Nitrosopumilus sp. TaxID=2024843 RepID=UPI003B5B4BD9
MSKLLIENTSDWRSASKYILGLPEIRFVGVINDMGNLVLGEYKKGIVPIAEVDQYKMCMEHALELFMKKDLDGTLGPLDYIVSKRKNVAIITIPVSDYLVLISAEPNAKIEPIIEEILQKLKMLNRP